MSLCDHPFVHLGFEVTERLAQSMEEFEASHWRPTVQALAKAQSPGCREAFDLHLNSSVRRVPETGVWEARLTVAAVLSKAAGSVKIVSPDPAAAPVIDHAYLSDAEGHDLRILVDGIQLGARLWRGSGPQARLEVS
jgi:choline dehydrogenase-like flavoprotein